MSDKTTTTDNPAQNIIDLIAQKKLGIASLKTQNSDRLDFHELSVASIREALETAFKLGVEAGMSINQKGAWRWLNQR